MVGHILRKRREQMGLTLSQMYKGCGISPQCLSRLETDNTDFYMPIFLIVSAAYGLDPHFLLDKIIEGNGRDKENHD